MNADFAGNPNREVRVASVYGHTYAKVDRQHIEALVSAVVNAAGNCFGSILNLHVFMPPYEDNAQAPDGYMEFRIDRPSESSLAFAVEFGGKEFERLPFSNLTLRDMKDAAKNFDSHNITASVANFDELWLFVCNVAERLQITKITTSFGI